MVERMSKAVAMTSNSTANPRATEAMMVVTLATPSYLLADGEVGIETLRRTNDILALLVPLLGSSNTA